MSFGRLGQLALFMALLYWGRPVLVPLALAFYLAFVLTPPANKLEQLGLSRGLAVTGVAIGLTVAFLLRKVVAQLLYGVAPTDLVTFTLVPIALVAVALLSSLIPALRATRVDPAVAMRAE